MKILIELPTWLGDSVMITPAIENLISHLKNVQITLLGPENFIELLGNHPKVINTYVLEKNYHKLFKTSRELGEFDFFISFRSSLRSKFMKFCISSKFKYQFDKKKFKEGHQVEKYNQFINTIFNIKSNPARLILHSKVQNKDPNVKLLGINPGASYGSAKRWYPEKFSEVARELSSSYDIVIFGGIGERQIASDIEKNLIKDGITNYKNLSNKTSISELASQIKGLDLFITGDSGPMHLAAAFQIPTVAIFGPTKDSETSQWLNEKSMIVKKNLECQPCMKRSCPLKHHNCMKLVEASDLITAINHLN
tara:strand:- start:459 stop:1385 length:927 start_codon:yes stop_codon:yes gene_type:complete